MVVLEAPVDINADQYTEELINAGLPSDIFVWLEAGEIKINGTDDANTPQSVLDDHTPSHRKPDTIIESNLVVSGSKNARIPDPDDETVGYIFSAIEADEPGLLMHRTTITVPDGSGESTQALPEQWSRIAKSPDAMATPISGEAETQKDGRAWPRAYVDLSVPEVRVAAPPGDYRVWVMAARADDAVAGWEHIVDIPQEEEEDEIL